MRAPLLLALALAACADAAEVEPVTVPRFTVRGRWADPRALTWTVDATLGPLSADELRSIVARALDAWTHTGAVGFAPLAGDGPADVVFAFAAPADAERPDSPFGRDTSVAVTGPVGPGCTVRFDAGRDWREAHGSGASLYRAAVHETGHVLGLGHSDDRGSVLHPQREVAAAAPGASDLDGLHSLYGGGRDRPGDLVVEERAVPALRRVAPPGATDWTLFDTDGDGDDELLVWARSAAEAGALAAYHFAPGPRLERTVGPVHGVAGYGARVEPGAAAGRRWLDVFQVDGTALRWTLDAGGLPRDPAEIAWRDGAATDAATKSGDLDGDGRVERVTARR